MRYAKALLAAIGATAGAVTAALLTPGIDGGEWATIIGTFVVTTGATLGVPNAGFVDLSKLSPELRTQVKRFLNLD